MREKTSEKSARAERALDRLAAVHPDAGIALNYRSPLELLVAVVLSAQCTDAQVNRVTPSLFERFRTPADYARADRAELEAMIRPCGLFRTKSSALGESCRMIDACWGGRVPTSRAELVRLPGVGSKSAGVISLHLSGERSFPVDTHVARLAGRLDLSRRSDPGQIEAELRRLLPPERWAKGHHLLIRHGRTICVARRPRCEACPIADLCPRRGVTLAMRRTPGDRGLL